MKIEVITIPAEEFRQQMAELKRMIFDAVKAESDEIGEVLDLKAAAKFIGISESGLRQRIKSGTVPYIKNGNGQYRFTSKYLKLAEMAPGLETIERLQEEMIREFSKRR